AYSPTKVTLPPLGSETIGLPPLGGSSPGSFPMPTTTLGNPSTPPSSIPDIPAIELAPPSVREVRAEPKTPGPKAQPDSKAAQPPSKAESPKPAGTQKDLPADVF